MLGDISSAEQIYIACGYTDMRKSIWLANLILFFKGGFLFIPIAISFFEPQA